MPLNEKQKEAVTYLDGPLLVLAGPGTGKTQLLSEKVVYILKNTDTNPENILCLTFTESGASNMRERLKTLIGESSTKVNIGTYHAFGTEILALYKNYSDDYDRKLDSSIDEITQFKIIKSIQDGLDGTDILRGDSVKDIISVISAAKSAGLTASDLETIAKQNIEDSRILSEAISPLLQNVVPRVFDASFNEAYTPIYDILKDYTSEMVIVKKIERSISYLARDLKKAYLEAESARKIKPLSSWKDSYFEKDDKGNYRLKDRIANKKLLSIANVMNLYDQYLLDNGLYDFDDMIMEAANALKRDAGFKATLSERYQFILLDEFQDTNPAQFAIIKGITDYEKPMIMAVGDDDQAIYEFQGALASNLRDYKDYYDAHVVSLVENYRSTQEILDFSRKIINQAPDRFEDKKLQAHKINPKVSHIYRHEFKSSDQEYSFVADEISKLIKNGVSQSEIAIISYKTKYFMPLLPFLKSHSDIKINYEKKNDLFEDERIRELLTISRFVHETMNNAKSTVNLMEVLAYPFWGLPIKSVLNEVYLARTNRKTLLETLVSSHDLEIQNVSTFLTNLVAKAIVEPLEVFLNYLIGNLELDGYKSPFLNYYSDNEAETFSLYENLASLIGKLKKHFGDKALKLEDLIMMISDYESAKMPLTVNSPYREADDAVSILTAHKAKGLEFKYVFIISADHTAWGKGKGNNNLLSLPKNLTQIRHTGITDSERLRVLYVSLTRAKETLYITNSEHDFSDKSPERLEYLNEYDTDDGVVSPLIPSGKVVLHDELLSSFDNLSNVKNWLTPFVASNPDLRLLYKERVDKFRMSASALTTFLDIVYAGPQAFFKSYILRAPREPQTFELAYGDLIHQTFEAVTNHDLNDDEAVDFFLKQLEAAELPHDIKKRINDRGAKELAISLKRFGELLRKGKAEVDLGAEKILIRNVPVTGKIDHMIIDEANKQIEIYDFKTGSFHKERWQSHATLFKYMLQLIFYKKMLENSSYSKYKVTKAHILFVIPDSDDELYDKEYVFNEQDDDYFMQILIATYEAISSLKFIDDKDVFLPANNSLGLKDIKKFIELVLAKY